jgi:uncharacterized damage-inducible protein DinB
MDANAFRHFYEYHFTENRRIWDRYVVPLSQEQFIQEVDYSYGSVRNQIVHIISADDYWFSGLRGVKRPEALDPARFDDRQVIRALWDDVERNMRAYLTQLRDEKLFERPFMDGEDDDLFLWQALLHVANHGTDHRAQILRLLHDLGVKTSSQDYIFYIYGNL